MNTLYNKLKFEVRVACMRLYNTFTWRRLWLFAKNNDEKKSEYTKDLNKLILAWQNYLYKEYANSPYIVRRAKPVLNDLMKQAERTCGIV